MSIRINDFFNIPSNFQFDSLIFIVPEEEGMGKPLKIDFWPTYGIYQAVYRGYTGQGDSIQKAYENLKEQHRFLELP